MLKPVDFNWDVRRCPTSNRKENLRNVIPIEFEIKRVGK
jgi:hypothetical protein